MPWAAAIEINDSSGALLVRQMASMNGESASRSSNWKIFVARCMSIRLRQSQRNGNSGSVRAHARSEGSGRFGTGRQTVIESIGVPYLSRTRVTAVKETRFSYPTEIGTIT